MFSWTCYGRAFINKRFADDEVTFVKRNAVAVREDPGGWRLPTELP
jgi:hypothetical protein